MNTLSVQPPTINRRSFALGRSLPRLTQWRKSPPEYLGQALERATYNICVNWTGQVILSLVDFVL